MAIIFLKSGTCKGAGIYGPNTDPLMGSQSHAWQECNKVTYESSYIYANRNINMNMKVT